MNSPVQIEIKEKSREWRPDLPPREKHRDHGPTFDQDQHRG